MGHYPTGPTACILDPTCHVMITSMWDGGPVCIFVFWVTVVLSCSTFFLWKQHYLKKHPVKPVVLQVGNLKGASHANQSSQSVPLQCNQSDPRGEHSGGTKNEEIRLSLEGESEIQFTGYTRSYFGEFCYLLCCLVSLHWIALYILILVDTYNNCEVGSIDNLCFFGNHFIFGTYELNGKPFGFQLGFSTRVECTIGSACPVIYPMQLLSMYGLQTSIEFSLSMFYSLSTFSAKLGVQQ
jgi:hypothetical protein